MNVHVHACAHTFCTCSSRSVRSRRPRSCARFQACTDKRCATTACRTSTRTPAHRPSRVPPIVAYRIPAPAGSCTHMLATGYRLLPARTRQLHERIQSIRARGVLFYFLTRFLGAFSFIAGSRSHSHSIPNSYCNLLSGRTLRYCIVQSTFIVFY